MRNVFGLALGTATAAATGVGLPGRLFLGAEPISPGRGGSPQDRYEADVFGGERIFDLVTLKNPSVADLDIELLTFIEISRDKRLNTTVVNEDMEGGLPAGEVIESYGWRPWKIRMKGLLVDMESKDYPLKQLQLLKKMADVHDTLEIVSPDFLTPLGITFAAIKRVQFARDNVYPDTQLFTLNLQSHAPIEALIL